MNQPKLEMKLLSELGFQIENNNSITYTKNGEKILATCNKKPVLVHYDATVTNPFDLILLNLHSQFMNCSYYLLKNQISSMLSSKINTVLSSLLQYTSNTDLYYQGCKELDQLILDLQKIDNANNRSSIDAKTSDKWRTLYKIIQEQPIQDILIRLNQKFEPIEVDDQESIDTYNKRFNPKNTQATYIANCPFIELSFPFYELLIKSDNAKLLGVDIEQKDIDIFKI
jgi:hypothetical protein